MRPLGWSLVGHIAVGLLVLVAARFAPDFQPAPAPAVAPLQTVLVEAASVQRSRPPEPAAGPPSPALPESAPEKPAPAPEAKPPPRVAERPQPRPVKPLASRAVAEAGTRPTARDRLAAEAALEAQLAAESAPSAAPVAGELDEWNQRLRERIEAKWYRPASARRGLRCRVVVTLVPGGSVVGAVVEACNGDAAVKESLRSAVVNASPLPLPRDPRQFQRKIVLEFTPDD